MGRAVKGGGDAGHGIGAVPKREGSLKGGREIHGREVGNSVDRRIYGLSPFPRAPSWAGAAPGTTPEPRVGITRPAIGW